MYTILVCDDEKDIVSALNIYLSAEGYRVLTAYDGYQALRLLDREEVHLILLDVMMPGMDGITAMTRLRQSHNLPVILLTAKSEDTDKVLGLNMGADDYVTKPFNPVELLARVRSQLRRYMTLGGGHTAPSAVTIGGVSLDDNAKTVTVDGDTVNLTPLAGVAAVNGVSELIMVYFYDVWNPHPVRLWVVTVLCAVVAVGSLLFSLSAAGHWPGHEGVHLTWLDRIPLDVFVLALAGEWLIYENASYYPSSVLGEVVFVALAYLFILAFTARCKAGMVLADLVVLRLLRLLSRGAVWAWRHLRVLVLSLPLTWKTAAVLVALMAAELLMLAYDLNEAELAVYLALHILILGAAMWQVLALRKLQQGGENLAKGDFSHPITLSRGALPELKRHAANLNSVQQGIQQAVEEKMKSERLKTQLITNVSHDIKTPLTSIVNYVDLLKKEEMPSDSAREYLEVLDRQSQRLRKLTEDLVEASKASTGNIPVSLAPTDLNVLLSQVCGEYQQRLEKQVLEPVLSLCEPGAAAMADGRLLWRVLDNLMSNICKYAMPGTRVYLTTEREGDTARMVVKNISRYPLNISADELTERFVRGDSSRSTEGSGLGLSIATSLMSLQGGGFRLTIDGDLFKVTLTLPAAGAEE